MRYLDNFHYQITGNPDGHKLVFLHGLMGSGSNWLKVTPAFQNEFHILTFDQRGHGRSFHPPSGYRPRDYAEDLKQILDELGWSQVTLVGHSMGGRNALEFAHDFSQRVKLLVLEDIGPDANFASIERISRLLELVPTPFATRPEAKTFFEEVYPSRIAFYPQPETLSRFFLSNMQTRADGQLDWRFAKDAILKSLTEGRSEDRWDYFFNLRVPTLVIRGAESPDLTRAVYERMIQASIDVQGLEIPGAGHWVHFDQLAAFVAALKDFFHVRIGTNL